MTHPVSNQGIVLFAHGSRDPLWHKPMEAVAARVADTSPDTPVVCAYLELSTPDLATAVNSLLDRKVQHISIIPMFLGVGKHAREDLPLLVNALRELHPNVQFQLNPSVGEESRLLDCLAQIALESL